MAFSLHNQLRIQSGDLKPTAVTDELIETAHASSINFARDFQVGYKDFVAEDKPLATKYLDKMLSATSKAITSDSAAKVAVMVVMASLIADKDYTVAEIQGASESQWEGFVDDNMQTAVELFAKVRQDEKAEYDAL